MVGGSRVGVLGGDDRERELVLTLARAGYRVLAAGRHLGPDELQAGAAAADPRDALAAPVVVGPLPGVRPDGQVASRAPHPGLTLCSGLMAAVPGGATWLCGELRGPVAGWLAARGASHVNLAEHDQLAVLNSIPTAEGAIMLARQHSPLCLHGSVSLVLGYGRCAVTLAAMLRGIGGQAVVLARDAAARARAAAAGHLTASLAELPDWMPRAQFCFNTIPAMVVPGSSLELAPPDLTLIDLASPPGGADHAAAARLGLRALLAPGLPGLVAPKTSGRYLAQTILAWLEERTP